MEVKSQGGDGEKTSVVSAPISIETEYWSNFDFLVYDSESPLGYGFMVEVWNDVAMLQDQLDRCLASFSPVLKRDLGLLYRSHLGLDADLSELQNRVGPRIVHEEDPRVAFQEREVEACDYLRRPLARAYGEEANLPPMVRLNGKAVRAARGSLKLGQVRDRVAELGQSIDVPTLFDLEDRPFFEVQRDVAIALAQALHVPISQLGVSAAYERDDPLARFTRSPTFETLVAKQAQTLGIDRETARRRAQDELLTAAARETRGAPDHQEWERMLRALLETWEA